jgi:hypothetical protein
MLKNPLYIRYISLKKETFSASFSRGMGAAAYYSIRIDLSRTEHMSHLKSRNGGVWSAA